MPLAKRSNAARAVAVFAKPRRPLRTRDALLLGVHPRTLYSLRDSGVLERLGCGIYRLASLGGLSNPEWVAIAMKAPRAVVCLITALAYHGRTTEVPHSIDIAMPSHSQVPRVARR